MGKVPERPSGTCSARSLVCVSEHACCRQPLSWKVRRTGMQEEAGGQTYCPHVAAPGMSAEELQKRVPLIRHACAGKNGMRTGRRLVYAWRSGSSVFACKGCPALRFRVAAARRSAQQAQLPFLASPAPCIYPSTQLRAGMLTHGCSFSACEIRRFCGCKCLHRSDWTRRCRVQWPSRKARGTSSFS